MAILGTQLALDGNFAPTTSEATASISPAANAFLILDVIAANNGGVAPALPSSITGNGLTWVQIATTTFSDLATETWRLTRYRAQGASPTAGVITIAHTTAPSARIAWSVRQYTGTVTTGTNGSGAEVQTEINSGDSTGPNVALAAFANAGNGADALVGFFSGTPMTPEAGWTGYTEGSAGAPQRAMWRDDPDASPSATISAADAWAMVATEIAAAVVGVDVALGVVTAASTVATLTKETRDLLVVLARGATIPALTVALEGGVELPVITSLGTVQDLNVSKGSELVPVTGSASVGGTIAVFHDLGAITASGVPQSINPVEVVQLPVFTASASVQQLVKDTRAILQPVGGSAQVVVLTSPSGISILLDPVVAVVLMQDLTKERRAQIEAVLSVASVADLSVESAAGLEAITSGAVVVALTKEQRAYLEAVLGRAIMRQLTTPGGEATGLLDLLDLLDILGI